MDKTFELQQHKEKGYMGCTLTVLVMIFYLVLVAFFSRWGAGGILLLMGTAAVAFYFIQNRTRSACIVTTNEEGFTLEVTNKSAEIEIGTRQFLWENLTEYNDYYIKGRTPLVLEFADGEEITFYGDAISEFKRYLVKRFPERDYEKIRKKRS